ncbi:MAG: type II toxin-antitoxin system RelE/ParE family toxin [Micropepsaceae bacterium]
MTKRLRKIPLIFYQTATGVEPVRDWIRSLSESDRNAVGQDLMRVQFGWPVGMPLCRALDGGLWEVRTTLEDDRQARVLFFFHESCLAVVNGFIKKTQKTPQAELDLARKRMKEVKS